MKVDNMLQWLHSLLPHIPRFGYLIVFIVVFLNNIGIPLPGESMLLGAGFVLGRTAASLWKPTLAGIVACFLGGLLSFWLGRRLGHGGLTKTRWLHLTPERVKRGEHFFKRHGAKTVFIARFIALLPPALANLLAGVAKMRWRSFLFYDLAGSTAYTITYILIGYFFGKKWERLEAWLGPTVLYLILAGIALTILLVVFRHFLHDLLSRLLFKKRKRT